MNKKTITILIIILVTASIAGAFWFFQKDKNNVIPAKAGISQKDDIKTVNETNSNNQEKAQTTKEGEELNFDEFDISNKNIQLTIMSSIMITNEIKKDVQPVLYEIIQTLQFLE